MHNALWRKRYTLFIKCFYTNHTILMPSTWFTLALCLLLPIFRIFKWDFLFPLEIQPNEKNNNFINIERKLWIFANILKIFTTNMNFTEEKCLKIYIPIKSTECLMMENSIYWPDIFLIAFPVPIQVFIQVFGIQCETNGI